MELALFAVGSLARTVLPVVLKHVVTKLKKPVPVAKDVRHLTSLLNLMNDAIRQQPDARILNHMDKVFIARLCKFAYEIEDCIERFLHQVMSDGREKEDTSEEFGGKIASLRSEADDIEKEFFFALAISTRRTDGASSSTAFPLSRAQAPTSRAPAWCDPPVGIDKPLGELKMLVQESRRPQDKKLKVISIVGFGGLGKTLLANQVFEYHDDKTRFDLRVLVRAYGKKPPELLTEILEKVREQLPEAGEGVNGRTTSDSNNTSSSWGMGAWTRMRQLSPGAVIRAMIPTVPQAMEKNKGDQEDNSKPAGAPDSGDQDRLINLLKALLYKKRYLILIIDMSDKSQWSGGIENAFPADSRTDSRIIVTTTQHEVARCCSDGNGHVYKMSKLSGDDSGKLFLESIKQSSEVVPEETSAILEKCDGLPLAVLSISHYCRGDLHRLKKTSEDAFRKICGRAHAEGPSERMQQVLLSTYEGLPNHFVKACLLYFCMFPRDHDVRSNSLMRRLLAEGLAETGDGESVGNLETLIDRSIIESIKVCNNERAKEYKVPGIVLEYITHMSRDQDFVRVWDENQRDPPPTDARRLSLHPRSKWKLPPELPNVRTLAVFSKKEGQTTALENKKAIAGYNKLRVLDMEGCGALDNKDLKRICCNLVLLKYLSLGGSISKVPTEIKKLQLLETLDLRKTQIHMVPIQVIELPRLKHLLGKLQLVEAGIFRRRDAFTENKIVRRKIVDFLSSEDSKLDKVSGFVIGRTQGFPQLLSHMTKMRKVKIWCNSTASAKNIVDLKQGIRKFLCLLNANDRSLCIDITDFRKADDFLDFPTGTTPDGSRPSLYSFKLYGKLTRFPAFLKLLSAVTELCLSGTNLPPDEMVGGLNSLEGDTLKYLKLVEEELGPLVIKATQKFKSLQRMCLVSKKKMGMITLERGALPQLVSLHILCKDLDGLTGIEIQGLQSLKELGLHSGLKEEEKFKWETAARGHPNWPNLVSIDPPKS